MGLEAFYYSRNIREQWLCQDVKDRGRIFSRYIELIVRENKEGVGAF